MKFGMRTGNAFKISILNFGDLMLTGPYFQTNTVLVIFLDKNLTQIKRQFTKGYSYVYDVSRPVIPRRGHQLIK